MRSKEAVQDKLKALPAAPGCYLFKDEKGDVLYVGKAIVLKNRVRSYFHASTKHSNRIARMVHKVRDLEWIVVDSELEALVLECTLIKKHRPPYNVRLRDDKSYPYITITNERFPRVMFTRRPRKDGAKYFGPYTSAFSVRETLQLLHRVFPLIPCGKSWSGREEQRPCLYYHLKQCMAPCAGLADVNEYKRVLADVRTFLEGREESLVLKMRKEMEEAAEALEFEEAARLRDTISSIESVLQRQKVISENSVDQDVIAVVKDERGAAIQMLYVRAGKLIGQRQFYLDGTGDSAPGEAVQQFVMQYYADAPEVPREVLLPVEIEERAIVQQWLRGRRGAAVSVEVPQGGDRLRLVEMAANNAEQALSMMALEMRQQSEWTELAMAQLQEALDLPTPPVRVEGYDISNIQGTAPVGSMVVTENGEAAKDEYRRFKVKYHPESPNDFAMMYEVLFRRFRAFLNGDDKFAKLPDLIMIDGGRGQLAAALKARDELGLTVPMVGLAKRMELLIVPTPAGAGDPNGEVAPSIALDLKETDLSKAEIAYKANRNAARAYTYHDVELPLNSPGLMLLRRLRDEAHRFALSFHRKLRDKRMSGSLLEEIPGVGPRRRRLLLRTFGSIEAIRRATAEEIAAVPTMTEALAKQVKSYLSEE